MTALDRYLAGRLASTFLKTLFALLGMFVVIDLTTHLRGKIMELDIPAGIILEYYAALAPGLLIDYKLAPLSLLVAGLLVFGQFVQRSEYTAALAGGIGLRRLMLGPLLVSIIIVVAMFALGNGYGPYAAGRVIEIENHYFGKAQHQALRERRGIFWPDLEDGWKCDVRKFNRFALTGEDVFMYAIQEGRHEQIQARRIYWHEERDGWYLEDGQWSVFDEDDEFRGQTRRFSQIPAPFSADPGFLMTAEVNTDTLSILQLAQLHAIHKDRGYTARRLSQDLHTKIVDPMLSFVFLGLAIPFSVRLGRGGVALGLSVAILLGVGYMVVSGVTQGMGYTGQIPAILPAWIPFAVYFVVCSTLISRTPT